MLCGDVFLFCRDGGNGSLQVGGQLAQHYHLAGGVGGNSCCVHLEFRNVTITASCCCIVDVEADVLVTLGLKTAGQDGLGVAGERSGKYAQLLASSLFRLWVVSTIYTPFNNVVIGYGTAGKLDGGTSYGFGFGQFHLQIVGTVGAVSVFPAAVPICCGVAVQQIGIHLFNCRTLCVGGGHGTAELGGFTDKWHFHVHLNGLQVAGNIQHVAARCGHFCNACQHGVAVADGSIVFNHFFCHSFLYRDEIPCAGIGCCFPTNDVAAVAHTASVSALVQQGEAAVLVGTSHCNNVAVFFALAAVVEGNFTFNGIQCLVYGNLCTLGNSVHASVCGATVHFIITSFLIVVNAEQEVDVCLVQSLPHQFVAVSVHGLGGICGSGLYHLLTGFGVKYGLAVLVHNGGAGTVGVLQAGGEEIVSVGIRSQTHLGIQYSLVVGLDAGNDFFCLFNGQQIHHFTVQVVVHINQIFLESFPCFHVAVLSRVCSQVKLASVSRQVTVILGQDVVEHIGNQTFTFSTIELELCSVPIYAVGGAAVHNGKAQVVNGF